MKIDAYKLKNFVKKASLNGEISSINVEFKKDGLHSRVMDIGKIILTDTFLSKDLIEDYQELDEVFIRDTAQFMKYIQTFGSDVTLAFEDDYILHVSDMTRDAFIMLGAEIVCDNVYREDLPTIPTTVSVEITSGDLARTFADVSLLKINQVHINKEGEKLFLRVGQPKESDYFINIIDGVEAEGKGSTSVGAQFCKLAESLDKGAIKLDIGDGLPLIVSQTTDTESFTCIIAPMTEKH